VQPGVIINYAEGSGQEADYMAETVQKESPAVYVANGNPKKYMII